MVNAVCTKACFVKSRLYEPGMTRVFEGKDKIEPCFRYVDDVKELAPEGPDWGPFSQWTKEQYLEKAKDKGIEIPADVKTRDDLKKFLSDKIAQD